MLIFWTFAFPIILGTFFSLAFSDIEDNEKLKTISIAIINNQEWNQNEILKNTFQKLDINESEEGIFDIQYLTEEKAKELLEKEEITGYITYTEKSEITIKQSGINETILKSVLEEINETMIAFQTIISKELQNEKQKDFDLYFPELFEKIKNKMSTIESETYLKDTSSKNLSYTMIEYYTLIAMTCLYGGILAMTSMNHNLANMSVEGKRISISATRKISLIASSAFASFITQLCGLLILFLYTIYVLKVDYGSHTLETMLLSLIGSFAGLSLGIWTSSVFKTNENNKLGIILAITMTGCFLSGMMGITMKYVIDSNIPILNKINPAAMITDGFYSLYHFETFDRFYFNIISLLIFSSIMIALSIISLRRQKYDSI